MKDSHEGAAGAFHELCPIHPFKHAVLTHVKEFFTLECLLSCITMVTICIYLTFFFKSVGINKVIITAASQAFFSTGCGLEQTLSNTHWCWKHARAWLDYHLQPRRCCCCCCSIAWAEREDTSKCYTKATTPGQTLNGALRRSCSNLPAHSCRLLQIQLWCGASRKNNVW